MCSSDLPEQEDVTANEVFDDEDELSVSVGDLVGYIAAESPHQMLHVRLTARQTDPARGFVAEATPLGAVLLGASVGDTVVLRVPGKPAQTFTVKSIKRQSTLE